MENADSIERELAAARARLDAFDAAVTPERLLGRLETEMPAHPFLLGYKFFVGIMAVNVILTLVVMVTPMMSGDWARRIADFETRVGLPAPLLLMVLALCALGIGVSSRYAATIRAQRSPMLADELKEHQAITADIARLNSKKKLQERGFGA